MLHVLSLDVLLKADQGLTGIRALLELDVLRRDKHPLLPGKDDSPVVVLAVVEVDHQLLLGLVDRACEGLQDQGHLQLVAARQHDLGVDDMQDVLRVLSSGGVVKTLDFIEGRVPPSRLIAGTQLSVSAGDLEMGVLHSCLVQMLLVKLQQSGLVQVEHADALTDSNGALLLPREDSVHETHLAQ